MQDTDRSMAARAAWLSYVGGYTQEEIAQRLGVSRVKVNRLIAEAGEAGLVRVFIEGTAAECVALEDAIAMRWGLDFCTVVPNTDEDALPLRTLSAATTSRMRATSRACGAPLVRTCVAATRVQRR